MNRARVLAVVLTVVAGLAGCTSGPVTPLPGGTTGGGAPAVSVPPPTGEATRLADRRAAAGIADCPATEPGASAVDGGLPDLELACLGGGSPVRIAALRGTPMVINLWATWCGPCRAEAPHLAEVAAAAGDRVRFLGVDVADPDAAAAIDFADGAGWRYPQVIDPGYALQLPLRLPSGIPATVLVRADGTIATIHVGPYTSADDLRTAIRDELGVTL